MESPAENRNPMPPVDPQMEPEKVLLTWESASRPYKKRDREYYTTIAVIVFLLSVILFFAGQFLLIAVIVSFAFVSYTLASVPPDTIQYSITTHGMHIGERRYQWNELGRYWLTTTLGQRVLHVEYFHRFMGNLLLTLGTLNDNDIHRVLNTYLVHQRPAQTFNERAAQWLQEKFPLDK